jgi:uncharacterized protein (UPF0147 family)
MLKKAAASQSAMKEQFEKLALRLAANVEEIDTLMKATNVPQYTAIPDHNVLANLLNECEDSDFWMNFRKAAPILFCTAIEHDINLKQVRDMSFIEELLKTKSIMKLMKDKVEKGEAGVDIVEYALATRTLEHKLRVLTSLNIHVDSADDQGKITLNVTGSGRAIEIDLAKLREAITVLDRQVEEKQASPADLKPAVEHIDIEGLTEEEYLNKAIEKIGVVTKTP